jgi:hypothetical protein
VGRSRHKRRTPRAYLRELLQKLKRLQHKHRLAQVRDPRLFRKKQSSPSPDARTYLTAESPRELPILGGEQGGPRAATARPHSRGCTARGRSSKCWMHCPARRQISNGACACDWRVHAA